MWTPLSKRQVAAECADPRRRELGGQCHQQGRIAVATRAMRQHQKSGTRFRRMHESPYRCLIRCSVDKRFWASNGHTYRWRTWASM